MALSIGPFDSDSVVSTVGKDVALVMGSETRKFARLVFAFHVGSLDK